MMRDDAKTIEILRSCSNYSSCENCPIGGAEFSFEDCRNVFRDAADAIEELLAAVRSVVRCKECEWWAKQEASIQGRCARLAIYPTGEFYCASGSKPEPPKEVQDG